MRFFYLSLLLTLLYTSSFAQNSLHGDILNNQGYPLPYSSVVLLNPADSTMEFFGITNTQGQYQIKNIKSGSYLLQTAFLGYQTLYQKVEFPRHENKPLPTIIMQPQSENLDEIKVEANYVPFLIKKDTIEFNTAAFKVKPDAMTEDLLKRFPGIEIDRAGNIKAFGEDVKKVLVDGKEFFGNDPKVATRNVPADAIEKVQVYDKKSDEADFTGIDDGVRSKTLNLTLKEDKKDALFGDVLAGGDFKSYVKSSAKAYKFSDKQQIAALGMYNNVNQFGFSFSDYMNFSGGLHNMMSGDGGLRISNDNSFPVNFGMPVTGLTSSGAGGLNYSYNKDDFNKIYFSYLGNGSEKDLEQSTQSTNFTSNQEYLQNQKLDELKNNQAHRLNFGLRNRINDKQNLVLNADASFTAGASDRKQNIESYLNKTLANSLISSSADETQNFSISGNGSYLNKINENKTVLKLKGNISYSKGNSLNKIDNLARYYAINDQNNYTQYQKDNTQMFNSQIGTALSQKLNSKYFIESGIKLGKLTDKLNRTQGQDYNTTINIDSLSPQINKQYQWIKPKISLNRNTSKTKLMVSLQMELGELETNLWGETIQQKKLSYFTPRLSYELEYKTGRRLMISYFSDVITPTVNQLTPITNNFNPLFSYTGNPDLEAEHFHDFRANWFLFDQFTFTSLMVGLNASYTHNKINWAHTVNADLTRESTLLNVDEDYRAKGSFDFSTAISKLGLKLNLDFEESYNQGSNYINAIENLNQNLSHRFSLSLENRNKNKLDIISGVGAKFTQSKYSIQESLNRDYRDYSWFGEIRYNPSKNWNFEFIADLVNYNSQGFNETYIIPLLSAEVSYYFLKNNRAMLSLYAFDLLNKNQIVQRSSELNYLKEVQSNTIGQYVMLSFKYRLNKFGDTNNGVNIEVNGR